MTFGIPGNWIGRQPENGGNSTQFMKEVAPCLTSADKHGVAQPISFGAQMSVPQVDFDLNQTLQAKNPMAVAQPVVFQLAGDRDNPSVSVSNTAFCLPANPMSDRGQAVAASMAVRRLTPVECERLQGFHDGYTNIPWRKADQSPDGPRYKALGNSMAVPVMAWIGRRVMMYKTQQTRMVA